MDISERKRKILKAVIDNYIDTVEPVGSKAVANNGELKLSSATIRNEMAELESMGYLEQPHASAGRVPSPKGYRLYVDELMRRHRLTIEETARINQIMESRLSELDHLLEDAAKLISQIMSYPTFSVESIVGDTSIKHFELIYLDNSSFVAVLVTDKKSVKNKMFRVPHHGDENSFHHISSILNKTFSGLSLERYTAELIETAVELSGSLGHVVSLVISYAMELIENSGQNEVAFSGASHLLVQPEYRDVNKAHRLLDFLSADTSLANIPLPDTTNPMKIVIGPENVAEELKDSSVVMVSYDMGDNSRGLIGVVGPTRMDYAKISAKLRYFAENLSRLSELGPPGIDNKNK